jgi:hypothetical protein
MLRNIRHQKVFDKDYFRVYSRGSITTREHSSMNPTSHLRFVERFVNMYTDPKTGVSTGHAVKILQQWWSRNLDVNIPSSPDGRSGEWRDVPMEAE